MSRSAYTSKAANYIFKVSCGGPMYLLAPLLDQDSKMSFQDSKSLSLKATTRLLQLAGLLSCQARHHRHVTGLLKAAAYIEAVL